jgi:hypothetical protein
VEWSASINVAPPRVIDIADPKEDLHGSLCAISTARTVVVVFSALEVAVAMAAARERLPPTPPPHEDTLSIAVLCFPEHRRNQRRPRRDADVSLTSPPAKYADSFAYCHGSKKSLPLYVYTAGYELGLTGSRIQYVYLDALPDPNDTVATKIFNFTRFPDKQSLRYPY